MVLPLSKSALRRAALQQRLALPPAEVQRRSTLLAEQLFAHFPVAQWGWLNVFLPLVTKNEPDTWRIIQRIWAEKLRVQLAVPVVQADGQTLRHYELTATTPLHPNRWGIPEPKVIPETEVQPTAFDAVLVPLLAVDADGHRVGYGGGFYDRFLAQCRPDCARIGVQLLDDALPMPTLTDVLPTDIPLTSCLTPNGVWRF